MCPRFLAVPLALALVTQIADAADGRLAFPFEDGIWRGDIALDPASGKQVECWAVTTSAEGTALTLANLGDGMWSIRLANPAWQLPAPHSYKMEALVDFYPRLQLVAEAKSGTLLEITDVSSIHLLGLIENGHTIDLTSEGFKGKYSLEGSAKVIGRLRSCSTE